MRGDSHQKNSGILIPGFEILRTDRNFVSMYVYTLTNACKSSD